MVGIRNISRLTVAAFVLLLVISTSKSIEVQNSSQNKEGIHALFTRPVEIPIDREVHHIMRPVDVDDRAKPQSDSENLVFSQEKEPGRKKTVPVNIQFQTQNPDGSYHFGYDIGKSTSSIAILSAAS